MPRCQEAKKDVASCDKPRLAASELRAGDFRMGQPAAGNAAVSVAENIGHRGQTRGTETSKYPEEEKVRTIL